MQILIWYSQKKATTPTLFNRGSITEWKKVSESEKKTLGLTFDDNGEFW
jgi:hypothetical protein